MLVKNTCGAWAPHVFFIPIPLLKLRQRTGINMKRPILIACLMVFCACSAVGCGGSSTRASDLPLTSSPEVDKKGKQSKVMEAGMADPNVKK